MNEYHHLDFSKVTPFETVVLKAVMAIPEGKVSTYGKIAAEVGQPGAARAVGNVMARNPYPIIVPCHRVVKSDRTLGGYSAGGAEVKKRLLEVEGIEFKGDRVKKEYLL